MKKVFYPISLCILVLLFISCEQPTNESSGSETISTASLGSGFTIDNESILTPSGGVASSLYGTVTAYVHNNEIATGLITSGKLSITIPSVNELYLVSQLNNENLKFDFNPADVKTGGLLLIFSINGTNYELVKGNYNSTYGLFNNTVDFVYTNKEAIETGFYSETTNSNGTPVVFSLTAKAHFITGWNKVNTKLDITATNTNMTINGLMTTNSVEMINNWYYKLAD